MNIWLKCNLLIRGANSAYIQIIQDLAEFTKDFKHYKSCKR